MLSFRFILIVWTSIGCSLALAGPAASQPARGGDAARERIVLQHAPVEETAASLRELFAFDGKSDAVAALEVTTDADEHAIEISGERATVASVRKLLEEIDAAGVSSGRTIGIEVAIFEVMVPVEDVAAISQEKLSDAAATEDGLASLLAGMGESRLVHRLSERVPFDRETEIKYSFPPTSQPIEELLREGRTQELARPEHVHGTVWIWPRSAGAGSIRVRGEGLTNRLSRLELGGGTKCVMHYKSGHDWSGPIPWGRAAVMLTTGAAGEESSKECISVVRFVVRDTQ